MQSEQSRSTVKLSDVKAYVPCPRSLFFLMHDLSTNRYRMLFFNPTDNFAQSPTEAIVHAAVISDLTPYSIYLDDRSCDQAIHAVGDLIVESVLLSINPRVRLCTTVPSQLKRLYSRTVHNLRTLADGCFMTELFLRKLWDLAYRTWRHVQAYYQWLKPKAVPTDLATELIC